MRVVPPERSRVSAASDDERQAARTRHDLVFLIRFLAAALLAADQAIFRDYVSWRQHLLVPGGIPPQALGAGLEALRPGVEAIDTRAAVLLDRERRELRGRTR